MQERQSKILQAALIKNTAVEEVNMQCRLIEVTVCDRPPSHVHSYRQKRFITPIENREETLVVTIFQEHFTSWVEKISCDEYVQKHNATFIGLVEVPQKILRDARKMVELKIAIDEIKEQHQISIYEVFAS